MDTGPRGRRLAVFEAPPIRDGWHGREVVRIIDPLGLQAAWIAPEQAGGVIGYYVRASPGDAWIEVLAAPSSEGFGCELLVRNAGSGAMEPPGPAALWELATRDATAAVVRGTLGDRRLVVATRCDDDGLHIAIDGDRSAPGGIGLRISPCPEVAAVEATTDQDGFIRFRDGDLAGLAYRQVAGFPAGRSTEKPVSGTSISSPASRPRAIDRPSSLCSRPFTSWRRTDS